MQETEIAYPSLGPDGYIAAPSELGLIIFADFYAADFSQSRLFPGNVKSLPWAIKEGGKDMNKVRELVSRALKELYGAYFKSAQVEVIIKPVIENDTKHTMSMYVTYTDNAGREYNLARNLELSDSAAGEILAIHQL